MAWYRAGSVAPINGSNTVTGTGTAFIANASIGEAFIAPDGRIYEITGIISDTSLTISPAYLGSNTTGAAYAIAPIRGRISDLIAETSSLLSSFASVRDGIGAGLMADGTVSAPGLRFSADQDTGFRRVGSNHLAMVTGGVDRVNVNGANVGIGTATPAQLFHVNGNALLGGSSAAQWSGVTAVTDVAIQQAAPLLNFVNAAGNTRFGYINHDGVSGNMNILSATASGGVVIWTNGAARLVAEASGTVRPGVDNTQFFGTASLRWGTIFSGTGTINTSDAREKKWIGAPGEAAVRAANRIIGELGFFQWSDAVEEKGEDGARIHFGVRAQEVVRIMIEEGLEAEQKFDFAPGKFIPAKSRPSFRHAFLCFDTWEAEGETLAGNRFGLRIDQLTMFLLAALASRVASLESAK